MAVKITDHVARALEELLEQYKGKPRIEGVLTCAVEQCQEIEDVLHGLTADVAIQTAVGAQLDGIGRIVIQDRLGFSDTFYRSLLLAKIGENVSQSDPERIIDVVGLLTGATLIHFSENYPAAYDVSIDTDIDPTLIDFLYGRIERVDPAGVRLESLICFDPDEAFAFAGGPGTAAGFGDLTAPLVGGVFAKIHVRTEPAFSFASAQGQSSTDEGFGTLEDPFVGGIMI